MKITRLHIIIISSSSVLIILLLLFILLRNKCSKPSHIVGEEAVNRQIAQDICQESYPKKNLGRRSSDKSNHRVFNKPFFSWADDPTLLAQVVENGWQRFSFSPSPSNSDTNVVTSWEIFEESADYMQKIRLNPGVTKSTTNPNSSLVVIRTALPLPGPQFENASFPREAYFEIKILPNEHVENELGGGADSLSGNEMRKLIDGDFNANNNLGYLSHSKRKTSIEQVNVGDEEEYDFETVSLAVGFTGGGYLPLETPGSFHGSVGFNSTGSVYLDGRKLLLESEKYGWGREGNVIGCGYNPIQKKVFFTLNSKLVNEIRCKTEEFEHPLYPTLAANTDITVVVNLGQSPFNFEAANAQRTSNPCFVNPRLNSSFYELDSKELFSMGIIDKKWKHRDNGRSSESINVECDKDEADLFDIVVK